MVEVHFGSVLYTLQKRNLVAFHKRCSKTIYGSVEISATKNQVFLIAGFITAFIKTLLKLLVAFFERY